MQPSSPAAESRVPVRVHAVRRALLIALIAAASSWHVASGAAPPTAPVADAAPPSAVEVTQAAFWYGTAADGTPSVKLYFFWTPTCPHCRAAQPFVATLRERLPWLEVVSLPVKDNPANVQFYYESARRLGVEATSVPGFLFCRRVEIGYDTASTTGAHLENLLRQCRERIVAEPAATTPAR